MEKALNLQAKEMNRKCVHMCNTQLKSIVQMYRILYYPQFQASTGGLGTYSLQIKGDY
jgi:hypothetical protein